MLASCQWRSWFLDSPWEIFVKILAPGKAARREVASSEQFSISRWGVGRPTGGNCPGVRGVFAFYVCIGYGSQLGQSLTKVVYNYLRDSSYRSGERDFDIQGACQIVTAAFPLGGKGVETTAYIKWGCRTQAGRRVRAPHLLLWVWEPREVGNLRTPAYHPRSLSSSYPANCLLYRFENANNNPTKAGTTTLLFSDKMDFRTRTLCETEILPNKEVNLLERPNISKCVCFL